MTWLLGRLRLWWYGGPVQTPLEVPQPDPAPVARLITPMAPAPTPEQLAHHARRKSRQNAHVATQAITCGGA